MVESASFAGFCVGVDAVEDGASDVEEGGEDGSVETDVEGFGVGSFELFAGELVGADAALHLEEVVAVALLEAGAEPADGE